MKNLRSNILISGLVFACVCALAGPVAADIPAYPDVQWHYSQDTAGGSWVNQIPPVDSPGAPDWETNSRLHLPNIAVENQIKDLWLEIEIWRDPSKPDWTSSTVPLLAEASSEAGVIINGPSIKVDVKWDGALSYYDVTWKWTLIPQPDNEWIDFYYADPGAAGRPNVKNFEDGDPKAFNIRRIEVATFCYVPLPGSLLLCGIGLGFAAVVRRFRRS